MALKSSNKVDTNVYEIEVTVTPEVFTDACKSAYMKQRGKTKIAQTISAKNEPVPVSSNQYLISTIQAAIIPPAASVITCGKFKLFFNCCCSIICSLPFRYL